MPRRFCSFLDTRVSPVSHVAPEDAAQLPEILGGNSDLSRKVYFKLWIEPDCLSTPGELHLNHLVIRFEFLTQGPSS